MFIRREEILDRLQKQIITNRQIIGVACGAGISAKYAEKGGADLILVLNSGRYRQMGVGSLAGFMPFDNCNKMVMDLGSKEIIPTVKNIPTIFGLCATDPTINLSLYLDRIKSNGFAGINNYPTIGMINGQFREALEEQEISYNNEVEAIRLAHKKDLFTIAFVFDNEQAKNMIEAGADIICAHLGLTKGGELGAKKVLSLEAGVQVAKKIFDICDELKPGIIRMIYGGPVNTPVDWKYIHDNTKAHGYLGGSAFERTPAEMAITNTTHEFKVVGQFDEDIMLNKMLMGIKKNYDYIKFVKEYISTNYMNEIFFSDLAKVLHISRTYLSTLFKKEVGCTFPEYLTRYRINKAIEIIKQQDLLLTEVANLVGYRDYAHFSKSFKKQTGISPRDFHKKNI